MTFIEMKCLRSIAVILSDYHKLMLAKRKEDFHSQKLADRI